MKIGKIISVSELGVEILTDGAEVRYRDMLYTELNGKHYRFEVQAVEGSIVNAISFESCAGLKRGLEVYKEERGLAMEYSDAILGKVFNPYGDTIDGTEVEEPHVRSVYSEPLSMSQIDINGDILWTGIKVLDFFAPMQKGSVFIGVGERSREGKELYDEMLEADLLDKMGMVFGQMGENSVSRAHAVQAGLTQAEYLRDEKHQDVLLFIDNIYRFIQATSEISAMMNKMPIENGYPATIESDVSEVEERINSTGEGSITSFQAIYIPADDITDEAVQTILEHLDGQSS